MNKLSLSALLLLILSGCSDSSSSLNMFRTQIQKSEEWKEIDIVKEFNSKVNLVRSEEGDLNFAYLRHEKCGGYIGYYDIAYNMNLDEEFYSSVEKISDLVDIDSLELDLFEADNGIATIIGLEDNKYSYILSISESRSMCDGDMYFVSKDGIEGSDY